MKKTVGLALVGLVSLVLLPAAYGDKKTEKKVVTTKSGLKYEDLKEGTGDAAKAGDTVVVHYTG